MIKRSMVGLTRDMWNYNYHSSHDKALHGQSYKRHVEFFFGAVVGNVMIYFKEYYLVFADDLL